MRKDIAEIIGVVLMNMCIICGFVFLAWHFGHWWIALFMFMGLFVTRSDKESKREGDKE